MLAIGRALMASPRLILADEMSQGLAPVIVQEVYRRLLEVNRRDVTILLVEQNARLAFKLAQFVYVMEQGRVVLEGSSSEVAGSAHGCDPNVAGTSPERGSTRSATKAMTPTTVA